MTVQDLADAIKTAIKNRQTAQESFVRRGTISGDQIEIDGIMYIYDPAVDIDIEDGDSVYAALTESGTKAVVIGK